MPSCAVKYCGNNTRREKTKGLITYHRIPSCSSIRKQWIYIIRKSRGEDCWQPKKYSYVCSDHFRPEDFYCTGVNGPRRLIKQSIPYRALFSSSTKSDSEISDDSENSDDNAENLIENSYYETRSDHITMAANGSHMPAENPSAPLSSTSLEEICQYIKQEPIETVCVEVPASPGALSDNSLEDVDDSEIESIFDNPVEIKLRTKLKRQTEEIDRHKRRIKLGKQTIRRLTLKNKALRSKLKQLQSTKRGIHKKPVSQQEPNVDAPGTSEDVGEDPKSSESSSSLEVSDDSEVEIFDSRVETKLRMRLKRPTKMLAVTTKKVKHLQRVERQLNKNNAKLEKNLKIFKSNKLM